MLRLVRVHARYYTVAATSAPGHLNYGLIRTHFEEYDIPDWSQPQPTTNKVALLFPVDDFVFQIFFFKFSNIFRIFFKYLFLIISNIFPGWSHPRVRVQAAPLQDLPEGVRQQQGARRAPQDRAHRGLRHQP